MKSKLGFFFAGIRIDGSVGHGWAIYNLHLNLQLFAQFSSLHLPEFFCSDQGKFTVRGKVITGNGLTEYFFYIRVAQTETA